LNKHWALHEARQSKHTPSTPCEWLSGTLVSMAIAGWGMINDSSAECLGGRAS